MAFGTEDFLSAVADVTAPIPRDRVDVDAKVARDDFRGTGNTSVHGARYVTHRFMSGPRLAVLSAGQCVKASRRNRYRGF
jgi:hypothetical protein